MLPPGSLPGVMFPVRMRSFLDGLTRPSGAALLIGLTIALAAITAVHAVVTPALVEDRPGLLATDPRDYDPLVSGRALRMRASTGPLVVIVGGSTVRDVTQEKTLASDLGSGVQIFKLCNARQSLAEMAAFAGLVPEGASGVLVVGVTPGLFAQDPSALRERAIPSRLAFRSQHLDDELRAVGIAVPGRSGLYVADNAAFFSLRLPIALRNALRGREVDFVDTPNAGRQPKAPAELQAHSRRVRSRLESYWAESGRNLDLLERVLARLAERTRMRVLLLDAPVSASFVRDFSAGPIYQAHHQALRQLAARTSVRYVDVNRLVDFAEMDFRDWGHVRNPDASLAASRAIGRVIGGMLADG